MLALSLIWLTVGVHANLDVALRTEERARSPFASDTLQGVIASDILLYPSAGVDLAFSYPRFRLAYSPRILMPEFYARFAPQILHSGLFSMQIPIGTRYQVLASE